MVLLCTEKRTSASLISAFGLAINKRTCKDLKAEKH